MKYFYELFSDNAKFNVTIITSDIGDKITIEKISDNDAWIRKQILPANGVYIVSFVNPYEIAIHTYDPDIITDTVIINTLQFKKFDKDAPIKYISYNYIKQAKPEPKKEEATSVTDSKTSIYYESRLMIDTVIRKLLTGHTKESIVANDGVTKEFLDAVEEILVIINMHSTDYANVDKLALLKDVVKNYVEHRCGKYIRSLYFRGEHTVDELLGIVDVPIEEFRCSISMLTLYRALFGEFVE